MELGGHAPVIVAEDADVELAVKAILAAKIRNAWDRSAFHLTRFFVHKDLRE
jgi:succinate-semialdehyde dehydrogenase/glutarate-semialdehyde dehydrogenase